MTLREYLLSLDEARRAVFATACGTTVDYLWQLAYSQRQPKARLAIAIERESGGKVRAEILCPDADWAFIRGQSTAASQ